jgi:hypothetical protein
LLLAFLLYAPSLAISRDAKDQARNDRIRFYKAELVCPAAPQIGCGSASKPILLELEGDRLVSEAWLDRTGRMIAVVWKYNTRARARDKVVESILRQGKVHEIKGGDRAQALKRFQSGTDWYRGEAVDKLSQEEAAIMASRLVRKMRKFVAISEDKGRALQDGFSEILARKLMRGQDREQTEKAILKICQEHLNEKDLTILQKANQEGAFSNLRSD